MVQIISVAYLGIFCFALLFFKGIRLSKKEKAFFLLLFSVSLANIAFFKDPKSGWDLISHFNYMDQIRQSSISFFDFLFINRRNIGSSGYKDLISFNVIRFLVSKITTDNRFLPWLCVLIDYGIFSYILFDWGKENKMSGKTCCMSLLLCFTLMPYVYAYSGIRNVLSFAFAALGSYIYLYKNGKIYYFAILMFVAITIHPSSIICVPIVFLAKIPFAKKTVLILFCSSFALTSIANWLLTANNSFLKSIAQKYLLYSSEIQYRDARYILYGDFILVVLFFILLFFRSNQCISSNRETVYNFLLLFLAYILSNIGNYDLFIRPTYLLGFFSPILVSQLNQRSFNAKSIDKLQKSIRFFCISLSGYMLYRHIIFFI